MEKIQRGLMTQYPFSRGRDFVCKNIGDYIQAVASAQYIDAIDEYIEQEEAYRYHSKTGNRIRLIMNGWFQWRAENWPPSGEIIPLLVSMHISPLREKQLLTPDGLDFLSRNAPIGCRDYYTRDLLQKHNIPSYFSACVTLTLGTKYKYNGRRRGYLFVDPFFDIPEFQGDALKRIRDFYDEHKEPIDILSKHSFFRDYSPRGFIDRETGENRSIYKAACFYRTYSSFFSDDILLHAEYITHWMDVDMHRQTNQDLMDVARKLVIKYSEAKLVVTSRIHAGLPCLGLGTPVVFVSDDEVVSFDGKFNTPGRLDGLVQLFRCINFSEGNVNTSDKVLSHVRQISTKTSLINKRSWKKYADALDGQLRAFMSECFTVEKLPMIRNMHV